MSIQHNYRKIIISRTDSIGDVVLTLPLAGLLKKYYPLSSIAFLGQSYTRAVIEACAYIDEFIDWKEISTLPQAEQVKFMQEQKAGLILHVFPVKEIALLAKRAGIPERIGSTGRLYHYTTCNRLVRLSRRNSPHHEATLNIRLAAGLLPASMIPTEDIPGLFGMSRIKNLPESLESLIDRERFNLILHPKSKGSAREWGSGNFAKLSAILPASEYKVFVTGTATEGELLREEGFFRQVDEVTDLTGKMNLDEMISFIDAADGLIAASTGPLHLAAALSKVALGIYPPIRPMHPGRWAPLGKRAGYLVADKECSQCRKTGPCQCMLNISPVQVKQKLDSMVNP
ncbi:glycosyltransferase family 9 protein [Lentimicrobium sp.]|uniref:glycosyltransferase family 9 protein n=1 Tax=Lentimicrobium sp. TaxID=2034841 RepID=UPI002CD2E4D7|nr:glycosyltransferase family 9 protein [Lentimicrobium sp.]HPJ61336.1 glycosyltransferase family 9 protein [Lentimicrobium sp.]